MAKANKNNQQEEPLEKKRWKTAWRLCKMNLAIRGIDSSNVKWNNEGSFRNDADRVRNIFLKCEWGALGVKYYLASANPF